MSRRNVSAVLALLTALSSGPVAAQPESPPLPSPEASVPAPESPPTPVATPSAEPAPKSPPPPTARATVPESPPLTAPSASAPIEPALTAPSLTPEIRPSAAEPLAAGSPAPVPARTADSPPFAPLRPQSDPQAASPTPEAAPSADPSPEAQTAIAPEEPPPSPSPKPVAARRPVTGDWRSLARRLTGESDAVRREAIRALRALPKLDDDLRAVLGASPRNASDDDRYLAYDVISLLRRRALRPELLATAETDPSGASVHALNALAEKQDADLPRLYLDRVQRDSVPVPTRMAYLDTLTRLGTRIPEGALRRLLEAPSPELRLSAILNLRYRLLRESDEDALELLQERLETRREWAQVRAAAASLARELPPKWKARRGIVSALASACAAPLQRKHRALELACVPAPPAAPKPAPVPSPPATPVAAPGTAALPEGCRQAYERLYGPPGGAVPMLLAFGYKDARPARFVADRYERAMLVGQLLASDGFERDPEDMDLFRKRIAGPDSLPRRIELTVMHSSAGPDDVANRKDPHQAWRSRYVREAFEAAAGGQARLAFYNGHSRAGGGPDFDPPRLLAGGSGVDYSYYQSNQPGLKQLTRHLKAPGLQILGMYSCASSAHFRAQLHAASPKLGLVLSPKLMYFSDAITGSREMLGALFALKCEKEIRRETESGKNRSGSRLTGFFHATASKRD